MANPEHLNILKQGVKAWNTWREKNRSVFPDLSRANLARANLAGANLTGANLTGADLGVTILSNADLTWVNLFQADLTM
ncbi:MAG: pentapeptide repeat-containing protein, partial [Nitrospinae bacterium]|nr:pentapeptide repeat-containing protein [Nitrospinota bacterium]